MKYASVCSGVEAASLAWMPLGWEAVWFSEIEPFPCAVLKERFPGVPNLGDMTKIKVENLENGDQRFTNGLGADVIVSGGVDLLVGGTPCQSFSVAGKREGLDGASGLAKTFVELLGIMQPKWFVWENVPGCLSSKSNSGIYDFNFLLAAFAERGYTCGWRILDSQYVRVDGFPRAVPQRRRRVFAVGHLGTDWEYPAEVLFEFQGLFGNHPPKRIKAKNLTALARENSEMASGALCGVESNRGASNGVDSVVNFASSSFGNYCKADCAGTLKSSGGDLSGGSENICVFWNGTDYAEANGVIENAIGCDMYNTSLTGAVSKTLNSAASDADHIPTCITSNGDDLSDTLDASYYKGVGSRNGNERTVVCVDQGAGKSSCSVSKELAPTLATTHGGEPVICEQDSKYYQWYSHNTSAKEIVDQVSPPLLAAMGEGGASMTTPMYITEPVCLNE